MSEPWRKFFERKNSLLEFSVSILLLVIVLFALSRFLKFVELRNGVILDDPILKFLYPADFSTLIFLIIYLSVFASLFYLIRKPDLLVVAIQSYTLLLILRIIAMYLIPLNPPANTIPLIDPLVMAFGTGEVLTKDLFFSGHTALLFLLFLVVGNRTLKTSFFILTFILAFLLLKQHVHYSIDVFCAPIFSYTSYKIILSLRSRI